MVNMLYAAIFLLKRLKKNLNEGKSYVLRLRSQGSPDKEITFVDSIKGEIKLPLKIARYCFIKT